MVTRSDVNYEQHKKDIYNSLVAKVGEDKATKFIEHYSARYDKYKRSFIDWRLAYWLMGDYKHLQKQ
jgi:hypothetical protein